MNYLLYKATVFAAAWTDIYVATAGIFDCMNNWRFTFTSKFKFIKTCLHQKQTK